MLPLIRAGYDFDQTFLLELDGSPEDASTYTLTACVVDERKRGRLIDDEAQAYVPGTTGAIRVTFLAANTSRMQPWVQVREQQGLTYQVSVNGAYQREAWLELCVVTAAGKRLPVAHCKVMVEMGWTGVL